MCVRGHVRQNVNKHNSFPARQILEEFLNYVDSLLAVVAVRPLVLKYRHVLMTLIIDCYIYYYYCSTIRISIFVIIRLPDTAINYKGLC
jgi:hypothetical protein